MLVVVPESEVWFGRFQIMSQLTETSSQLSIVHVMPPQPLWVLAARTGHVTGDSQT